MRKKGTAQKKQHGKGRNVSPLTFSSTVPFVLSTALENETHSLSTF